MPGLVIENGSGLSRNERVTAGGLAQLLAAADRSAAREEFASSLAVAATDVMGQKDIVDTVPEAARLYPAGDSDALAALLQRWLDHSELLAQAKHAALEGARQRWNWEKE